MKQKSNQLVFFGTEDFSAAILEKLLDAGLKFEAIITKPDVKKGRGQRLQSPTVKTVANHWGIPVFQPQNLAEMRQAIAKTSRFIGLLVSFGKIIPQDIIDSFELGIINLHPSLLPQYRGPSPIETAILNGDLETGVSVMSLNAKMDAGPIYGQKSIPIASNATASWLYQQATKVGSQLLIQLLPQIMTGAIAPLPQDDSQATYCQLLLKTQGFLNPESNSASQLARQIRAFERFPKSRIDIFDQTCIITEATADTEPLSPINFQCQDGNFLNIHYLIAPSGKNVSAQEFINGYQR